MKCIGRLSICSFFVAALIGLAGCGESNEDAANITGVENPETAGSGYEAASKGQQSYGGQGYPGAQ